MAMGYSLKSEQDTADAAAAADPTLSATPAEAIEADVLDKAQGLLPLLDTEDPEVIAAEILSSAAAQGVEPTGDTQVDLARIYQNLTGDPAAFEKNIDNLNRGIIGAAIGAPVAGVMAVFSPARKSVANTTNTATPMLAPRISCLPLRSARR
jgi:hypothetical protein